MKYVYESNNREPLPVGWDWATNSLRIAFPPPLIRGMRTGPPTPITAIGEARKARRRRILEARASKEVLPGHVIQDKIPEVTKENSNAMENDPQSKAPNVKGAAPNISNTSANSAALSPGVKNGNAEGKAKEQVMSQKGMNTSKGRSSENPFNLADFVPEPSKEDSSAPKDSWRGFRRPKEPPAMKQSTLEEKSQWPSWNDWEESKVLFAHTFYPSSPQ